MNNDPGKKNSAIQQDGKERWGRKMKKPMVNLAEDDMELGLTLL